MALIGAVFFLTNTYGQLDSNQTQFSFGFDGSRVFNQLFRANLYSSLVYGEYQFSEKSFVRLAGDLEQISGDDGKLDYQIKLGYKRSIRHSGNWLFYCGLDAMFEYEFNRNSQVEQLTEGGLLYVGATYRFSKHFSLSTEPTLFWVYKQKEDFDIVDSKKFSNNQGITHVGLVRASFHF